MNRFPDFGKELRRDFEVDAGCYDCVEFYGPGHGQPGCNARPAQPRIYCLDYFPLPPVGVNGKTGQEFPPSRMGGRKEPRLRMRNSAPVEAREQAENPPARKQTQAKPEPIEQDPPESGDQVPKQTRQQSPAGKPGLDGKRRCGCGCGTVLKKRERCCAACRLQGRKNALERYRSQNRPSVASERV